MFTSLIIILVIINFRDRLVRRGASMIFGLDLAELGGQVSELSKGQLLLTVVFANSDREIAAYCTIKNRYTVNDHFLRFKRTI